VNGDFSKTVRVSGRVLCEGNPVMEVQSAFFFCGRFPDYENPFETTGEPDYTIELITDADVGVPLSKDCLSGLARVNLKTARCWHASYLPPSLRGHLQGQGELSLDRCRWRCLSS
jgi:hypothetical protein